VLHERPVPHETKNECADEKSEHKDEKLGDCVRLVLGFGYFLNHFIKYVYFFLIEVYGSSSCEWI
jgi:hypothetical protein